jgi:2-amino-4-hydroxy-6-hydroxymethyldihydropteridine diphosphokinase
MSSQVDGQRVHGQPACAPQRLVVLSLGSNLGDRLANLQLGVDILVTGGLADPVVSGVYETAPVGGPQQDDFLNAVLLASTSLTAPEVLRLAVAAETAAGRVRIVRFGPRTLDVDVISYGDEMSTDPVLTLPHPRAHERGFVLRPWLDLDPNAVLPGRGAVADMLAVTGTDGVQLRADLTLALPSIPIAKAAAPCT